MMAVVGRIAEQVNLRLPVGLRDRIKAEASTQGRSINSEIVLLLLRTYDTAEKEKAGEPTTA